MLNSCAFAQSAPPPAPVSPAEARDLQTVRERVTQNARRDAVPRPDAVDKLLRDLSPGGDVARPPLCRYRKRSLVAVGASVAGAKHGPRLRGSDTGG